MVLMLAIPVGILVGLVLGGGLGALADLRLRWAPLFLIAIGLQVVAFPSPSLPWQTSDGLATALWLVSYALLGVAAVANRRLRGVPIIALGMLSNLVAVLANDGHMPATASAMRAAGVAYDGVHANSVAADDPRLAWLIDRWGAPEWLPMANVFSIGDVVIAIGAVVLVVAAMEPTRLRAGRLGSPAARRT